MSASQAPSLRGSLVRLIERLLGVRILRPAELAEFVHVAGAAAQLGEQLAQAQSQLAAGAERLRVMERAIAELGPANERHMRDSRLLAQQVAALTRRIGEHAARELPEIRPPFPVMAGLDAAAMEVHVVDVGAEPLGFEADVYDPMLHAGRHRIVGFDPFADAAVTRAEGATGAPTPPHPNPLVERVTLPYFVADGRRRRFNVNRFAPTSSLYPSNKPLLRQFSHLEHMCETVKSIEVETRRLDEIAEIERCDFLKIDVQGAEYDVLAHGRAMLSRTIFVHVEAEFAPIYTGQPLFSEIETLLRGEGFELIDFFRPGWNNYAALPSETSRSRLLWSDCIFMQAPERIAARDPALLLRAAYIAHGNYGKYDLAAHLIGEHDARTGSAFLPAYRAAFTG